MANKRNHEEIEKRKKEKEEYYKKQREDEAKAKADFAIWKTENGLNVDNYDVQKHGAIEHRCEEHVLFTLFQSKYERPAQWNSEKCYFEINLIVVSDSGRIRQNFIRCDRLCGAQFDHLHAVKLGTTDEYAGERKAEKRIEFWFIEEDATEVGKLRSNPPESASHPKEIGDFYHTLYDDGDDSPLIVVDAENPPLECLQPGFSVVFFSTLDDEGN